MSRLSAWFGHVSASRLLGILALNVIVLAILLVSDPMAGSPANLQNLARRVGFYGIFTLGAGLLIIAGGIDLSVGSVVGFCAVSFALLVGLELSPILAVAIVLGMALLIGLLHGFLVAKLHLQPFIVTLCGLFIYRGLAQLATSINYRNLWQNLTSGTWHLEVVHGSSRDVGLGVHPELRWFKFVAVDTVAGIPAILLLLLVLSGLLIVLLHFSVYGRYLYAVGFNESAARYAGIATDRYKILAFVICSLLAGLAGIIHILDVGTAQPSASGTYYELYAITGAVLGGCSLRGGQGTVIGMLLGTAVLPLLRNLVIFAGVPSNLEYTVIGLALLGGTIVDEILKRRSSKSG